MDIFPQDDEEPHFGYVLRAVGTDGVIPFSGQNAGVHLSGLDGFLTRFAEFIKTRSGDAVLEMTEGCRLEFFRWNVRGDVGVSSFPGVLPGTLSCSGGPITELSTVSVPLR